MDIGNNNLQNEAFKLLGQSGNSFDYKSFTQKNIKREDLKSAEALKIFDFYNTNKDGESQNKLDKDELHNLFSDLIDKAGSDKVLEPNEIKSSKYKQSVVISGLTEILHLISSANFSDKLFSCIDGPSTSSSTGDILKSIDTRDITKVLADYSLEHNVSLVQDLANESGCLGSTRNKYINTIKQKLVERAEECGIDANVFAEEFDNELKRMDITLLKEADSSNLDNIVNGFVEKLKPAEELYNKNYNNILKMVADTDRFGSKDDINHIVKSIIKYSNMYSLNDMVLSDAYAKSGNPKIKNISNNFKNSRYLDYFPIFVASIMSRETHFNETSSKRLNIFTEAGKGPMQITKSITDDIFENPGMFDSKLVKEIKEKYSSSKELYNALCDDKNSELNYKVGIAALKRKFDVVVKNIKNGVYAKMGITSESPATILELTAYEYNKNSKYIEKTDSKGKIVHCPDPDTGKVDLIKYGYAETVIRRFKQYTPKGITVTNFWEHNPKNNKFSIVSK